MEKMIFGFKKVVKLGAGIALMGVSLGACACSASGEKSIQSVFKDIYTNKVWWCRETTPAGVSTEVLSGSGSTMLHTITIRMQLPLLLQELGIKKMMDAPCGDFHWMKTVDLSCLDFYIGLDIVPDVIQQNVQKYSHATRVFLIGDLTSDPLACVDLILCRDCLAHLSYAHIFKAIKNMKQSGSTYLLATTFCTKEPNHDIATGEWRALNLALPPFNFPKPLRVIDEGWENKVLGLWKLRDLPLVD